MRQNIFNPDFQDFIAALNLLLLNLNGSRSMKIFQYARYAFPIFWMPKELLLAQKTWMILKTLDKSDGISGVLSSG